jgi:4'-phosphopantetheinyl transferase
MTLVDAWPIRTREPFDEALLDEEERARRDRIAAPADRQRYGAAHAAARRIVAEVLGIEPAEVRWTRTPNGKPELAGHALRVNLSHAGDHALVAVCAERAVGADLQDVVPGLDTAAMARRFFPPAEAELVAADGPGRFAQLWARKEAVVKAAGGRLFPNLGTPVAGDPPPPAELDGVRYAVADVAAPPGFRAAIALAGPEPFTVRMR